MAYSREDIDRVRDATDLVELASEVTKVRRSGKSAMAVCPFHQEKTASLSIDPARGLWNCFGCGKSGDVFTWVMDSQSLQFNEAVEMLARRTGITLTVDPGAARRRSEREDLVAAVEAAVEFYHRRLLKADDAGAARAYLRSRGYDAGIVEQFAIGYSPDSWDVLSRHLADEGSSEKLLVKAGLSQRSRHGRLIDRFRGRVMFPIYDLRGDPVGFGARLLEGDGPKYLNSPETPIYHKSNLLYGLNWAKSDIVRLGEAVVVEGYTDVIAFQQADRPVAVATCGTALGEAHLDLLRRFTERVVFAFDADAAGAGAAERGFEHSVPGDLELRVAVMPEGRDPADLVSSGDADGLLEAVASSQPLLQFRIERELEGFSLDEPEARGRAVRASAALIARHPDAVVRHEYAVLLARKTGVELDVVEQAVKGAVRQQRPPARSDVGPPPVEALTGVDKAEQELLRLYLANDPSVRALEVTPDLFDRDAHRKAFELVAPAVERLEPGEPPDLGRLFGDDQGDLARMLRSLALVDRPLSVAGDLVNRLKVAATNRRIESVRRSLEEIDPDGDPQTYSARLGELIALERQRRDLRSAP